jgi:hypothetical protein
MGKLARVGSLGTLVAVLAGCPKAPVAVRETVVRVPSPAPHVVSSVGERQSPPPPFGGQSPVIYNPALDPSPDPPATGVQGSPGKKLELGPDATAHSKPDPSASPTFKYAGQGLYAGPFNMSPTGAVIHVASEGTGTFVLHLDSDDQREKNLVLDAEGSFDTTFKFPGRGGPYAFFLQMEPLDAWSVEVYNLPGSPSPRPSASPSPTPSTSPSPSVAPSSKP